MNKVVISMSGGLDSTCLALYELSNGCEVRAFAFDYGQKHSVELEKLQNNIKFLQSKNLPITLQVINLKDVFSDSQSSLCGVGDIPKGQYENSNMTSTVVENRNVIFSSIIYAKALGWAKQTDSNVSITLGIHAGDHCLYPDTTPESQSMARELFRISNWGSEKVDYIAPFVNVTKGEVLDMGLKSMHSLEFSDADIEEVLKNTHTCYSPNENGESCGECGSCMERAEAFQYCDMKDPISFVEKVEVEEENVEIVTAKLVDTSTESVDTEVEGVEVVDTSIDSVENEVENVEVVDNESDNEIIENLQLVPEPEPATENIVPEKPEEESEDSIEEEVKTTTKKKSTKKGTV